MHAEALPVDRAPKFIVVIDVGQSVMIDRDFESYAIDAPLDSNVVQGAYPPPKQSCPS